MDLLEIHTRIVNNNNNIPYYMKSIRHIYRTHDYRTTCNSYELLIGKIQNLGQILIPLKV